MNHENGQSIIKSKIEKIDKQITILSLARGSLVKKLNTVNLDKSPLLVAITALPQKLSPTEKIALFKSYFRGRDDVYAKLWVNNRTGKHGYSPVCQHEWDRSRCRKPTVKCSECPNQQFNPLNEDVIRQHLSGNRVVGIYPILKNEACYFLAMDFDKENWFKDISALKVTCDENNIPAVIERSRSGLGGHLWIFFEEEISAFMARKLGSGDYK